MDVSVEKFKENQIVWVFVEGEKRLAEILSIDYSEGLAVVVGLEVKPWGHTYKVLGEEKEIEVHIEDLEVFEK